MKWLMAGCAVLAAAMSWAYVEVDDDVVVDYQDPKTKLGFDVSASSREFVGKRRFWQVAGPMVES